jgi:hypothetical protein
MTHYWGGKAIMDRLDIGAMATLYKLITRKGLPVFKRKRPGKAHPMMYSNDAMILMWELALAREYRLSLAGSRPGELVKPLILKDSEE